MNLIDGRLTSVPWTNRFDVAGDVGDRILYEPRVRFSSSLERTIEIGRNLSLSGLSEVVYIGVAGSRFDRNDPDYGEMGGYWLINIDARLRRSAWMASLQIENLLNDASVAWAASRPEHERSVIRVQPRTVRLALQRRW